ncbi:hypothetical protein [Salipaludibacillus daqingensis]|uniref:hypothetical protein n=1 Tax=Salipaludibacillus daqingensis TaxID=3041001 RepID=UPI00247511CC|nr:hypothetical protein [Salipaludibacillus daqingensis]
MDKLHPLQWLGIFAVIVLGVLNFSGVYMPLYIQSTVLGLSLVALIAYKIYKIYKLKQQELEENPTKKND